MKLPAARPESRREHRRAALWGVSLTLAASLGPAGWAAPRVGLSEDSTRLVFDLPGVVTPTVRTNGASVTILVPTALRSERGAVKSDDVRTWSVTGGARSSTVTLDLAKGRRARAFVLPAASGRPARLVVDVGTDVGGDVSAAADKAAGIVGTAPKAPVKTATPALTPASSRAPTRPKLRVVLDPGHGGLDPGMIGYVVEKEVTLDVSQRVRARLQRRGVEVVLTRDRDRHLSADKATDLGMRAAMAKAGTINAFVSIHVNAATPAAQGIETWVFGQLLETHNRSLAVRENGGGDVGERVTRETTNVAANLLGDLLAQSNLAYSKKLASSVQSSLIRATGAVNRGVGSAPFRVIRDARTPAILIELGFGSHAVEGRKLANGAYRDRMADAIADAIADFLHAEQ